MIKFCRVGTSLSHFFARYRAWVQFQNLSGPHDPAAVETGYEDDAIRIYQVYDIDLINQDPRPTVGIDLREGLKETNAVNRLPRNKHYIIFSGSYPNPVPRINVDHTLVCNDIILAEMYDLHFGSKSPYFYTDRTYDFDYPKSHVFVSFNGVSRLYRKKFVEWLPELPYKNFVFRLNKQDLGVDANALDIVDFATVNADIAQWFESRAQHTDVPYYHICGRIPNTLMNQSYFNLVLESDFGHETTCTTEKTIRPLLLGMPFVLASTPGHLAYIQSLGFRTYGDLWDESYDQEHNNDLRLRKVFELVKSLHEFDWKAHRKTLKAISTHNRAVFTNLGNHFDREFREFERIIAQYERRH